MATFREITYMVLDLLKERSDDAYYTEEHILFLASKVRAVLLERKYKTSRNTAFQVLSEENKQLICLSLIPAELSGSCAGGWLRTQEVVPTVLNGTTLTVYTISDMLHSRIEYISIERMPYIGHNKWLKDIIYCARSTDGYIYLHSSNPQFMHLEKVMVKGVFSSPELAVPLECRENGETYDCSVLDHHFPLEESLIASCVEIVVQNLMGPRYAPEDKTNNAKDNFGEAGAPQQPSARPVDNSQE